MISLRESGVRSRDALTTSCRYLPAVLVEHPLHGAVEQRGVRQVGDFAIEPEVHAR